MDAITEYQEMKRRVDLAQAELDRATGALEAAEKAARVVAEKAKVMGFANLAEVQERREQLEKVIDESLAALREVLS